MGNLSGLVLLLAVFGGGVAANQNLALIFESARSPSASGLGVALFALASTVSRVSVGVLSDKFSHVMSRFGWLVLVSACAVLGLLLGLLADHAATSSIADAAGTHSC